MKNYFNGHRPSHYQMNPIVRAFILSETFFWSGFNFVFPILTLFVVKEISGGSIEQGTMAISFFLIARVFGDLFSGKLLEKAKDRILLKISILGFVLVGVAYFFLSIVTNMLGVYILQILIGIGLGIASPPKSTLFSEHIDKEHATNEWAFYDAVTLIGIALATSLGGFIAGKWGFSVLFKICSGFVFLSILPYLLILKTAKKS